MNFEPQALIHIDFHHNGKSHPLGRLFLKDRKILFEYDNNFLKTGLEISPFKLPLRAGVIENQDAIFDGLFGVFNDSMPDGWGRLLLDRRLMNLGMIPSKLSPLDRLCFVGSNGMGALTYTPEYSNAHDVDLRPHLDDIKLEIDATLNQKNHYLEHLLLLNGSSAGARPKVLININNEHWLVKFRSSMDPADISAIEYAYHLMAKEAGLEVPVAKLFPSNEGVGFFGVQRFDRINHERIHMHTVAGLLHADHRYPSLDYEMLMKATSYLTHDIGQCEVQFRNAVFNVLAHNRDDHSKNFSFILNSFGQWKVSPAYDLTFSSGPVGEHSTMIMGEGKSPTKNHLLKLATIANISSGRALEIIDQVISAVNKWKFFATASGVTGLQIKNIHRALRQVQSEFS